MPFAQGDLWIRTNPRNGSRMVARDSIAATALLHSVAQEERTNS